MIPHRDALFFSTTTKQKPKQANESVYMPEIYDVASIFSQEGNESQSEELYIPVQLPHHIKMDYFRDAQGLCFKRRVNCYCHVNKTSLHKKRNSVLSTELLT